MGNFSLTSTLVATGLANEFVSQEIASVANFLPDDTGDRRQIKGAIRRIEIGGIVWRAGVEPIQNDSATPAGLVLIQQLWTFNRLDTDGFPIGVDYPWGTSGPPTANQPSATQEDVDEPIRILDRTAWTYGNADIAATAGAPVRTYDHNGRGRSLRLKAPLDQQTALLFTTHISADISIGAASWVFAAWLTGTIYYRYRW